MTHKNTLSVLLLVTLAGCGPLGARRADSAQAAPVQRVDLPLALATPTPATVPEVVFVAERTETPSVTYTLRRGETMAHFARWSGLPIEAIADASGLALDDDQLNVGTVIVLPVDDAGRSRIETNRDAHHVRRAEGWLASRGGEVGVTFYKVHSGDSAWTIAKRNGNLPVWVVESYNPAVDLDALRPGQELMLPVPADLVAVDTLEGMRPANGLH